MTKYLIINADDFGILPKTNKAIAELYTQKLITSTSLLAVGNYAREALALAKRNNISVGVHFAFNSDYDHSRWKAISPAEKVNSFADNDGYFYHETKYFNKNAKSRQLDLEIENQYKLISEGGVIVDHADSHSGLLYGINGRLFFINAFRFAAKYRLPFRFPKRPGFLSGFFGGNVPPIIKAAHKAIIGFSRLYRVKLIDDMVSNPYKIKDIPDYNALESYYVDKIRNLKDGVTEVFLHPSYDAPHLNDPEWKKRVYELEFLNSKAFRNAVEESGAVLCSYDILKTPD